MHACPRQLHACRPPTADGASAAPSPPPRPLPPLAAAAAAAAPPCHPCPLPLQTTSCPPTTSWRCWARTASTRAASTSALMPRWPRRRQPCSSCAASGRSWRTGSRSVGSVGAGGRAAPRVLVFAPAVPGRLQLAGGQREAPHASHCSPTVSLLEAPPFTPYTHPTNHTPLPDSRVSRCWSSGAGGEAGACTWRNSTRAAP